MDGKTLILRETGFKSGATGDPWWRNDGSFGVPVSPEAEDEMREGVCEEVDKEMTRTIERDLAALSGPPGGASGTTMSNDGLTLTEEKMAEVWARRTSQHPSGQEYPTVRVSRLMSSGRSA